MVKMIAFDLVGTLIRSEAFRDARSSLRLDFNQGWEKAEKAADFTNRFDYEAVFRAWLNEVAARALHQQFRDYLVERVTDYLYPEVCEVLKVLDSQGIRLGFVTDGSNDVEGKMIRRILRHCEIGLDKCVIVTGQDVGGDKESGKPFHKLIARAESLGIERANITFVGDNPKADIDGAKGVGLKAVLIRRPPLGRETPDREITSLMDLLDTLIL